MSVISQYNLRKKKLRHVTVKIRYFFGKVAGSEFYGNFASLTE